MEFMLLYNTRAKNLGPKLLVPGPGPFIRLLYVPVYVLADSGLKKNELKVAEQGSKQVVGSKQSIIRPLLAI